MGNWVRATALMSMLLGALSGCGAGGESDVVPPVLPREGNLRVVNAMPDAGAMSSFLSTTPIARREYGEASALAPFLVGQYVINILLTPPNDESTSLVNNEPVNLSDPDEFSFVMIGPTATSQLVRIDNRSIIFGVDLNKPAEFPLPDYQILHAATGVASVDVYVTENAADLATETPTATLNFGNVTPLRKLDPANTYQVRVTLPGSKTVLFDSGAFSAPRLKRSIYLVLDNFGPGGETVRVADVTAIGAEDFPNQTLTSKLRVENLIPDAPTVDVDLVPTTGAPVVFPDVQYGNTTTQFKYVTVPNGTYTVNIVKRAVPPDTTDTLVATGPLTIVGGQAQSLYMSRLNAAAEARFIAVVESLRSISGQAQLRFVAGAPSAGAIDVYVAAAGQPISDVRPILANGALLDTTAVNLTPGSYDVIVTRSGSSTVQLFGPERISVGAGTVYNTVLLDAPAGSSTLQLQVCRTLPAPEVCL